MIFVPFGNGRVFPCVDTCMYTTHGYPSEPNLRLSFRQDARRFFARLRGRLL